MSFSIIIPTMWKQPGHLFKMLPMYDSCSLIGEILIINNESNPLEKAAKRYNKVRLLNDGTNLFVNPSWNFGVKEAAYEKVIIANDDITFDGLEEILTLTDENLQPGQIFGFHRNSFKKWRINGFSNKVELVRPEKGYHAYGFGVFMLAHRDSWHTIPSDMIIWGGDTLQFRVLKPSLIKGFEVDTPMRGTSRHLLGVNRWRKSDVINLDKYLKKLCIVR